MEKAEIERTVANMIDEINQKGKGIPKDLSGFPELPYKNFEILQNDLRSGQARLFRFSYVMEPGLLNLLGSAGEKFGNTFGLIFAYGGFLASIAAAYFISWWLLILAPIAFIIGSKMTKNSYNAAIVRSAASAEILFCFLYFSGQISVDIPSTGDHYFFQRD